MIFLSETMTETITIKNLKLTSNMVKINEKIFDNSDLLYTVGKVLKSSIQRYFLSKTMIETITIKNLKLTSNMLNINEKIFDNFDLLYIVEKVLESSIQYFFRKQ